MHKATHEMKTKIITDGMSEKRSTAEVLCKDGDCQKKMLRGSSMWIQGADGSMHQKVHQETSSMTEDADSASKRMTELDCVDGFCRKQTMAINAPAGGVMTRRGRMQQRLQRMLDRLVGPRVYVQPRGVVRVIQVGAPPMQATEAAAAPNVSPDFLATDLLTALLIAAFAVPAVLALFSRRSSAAREIPLGEPLFPHAQGASAELGMPIRTPQEVLAAAQGPHKAVEVAQAAVQEYLPKLYEQASILADTQIARAYLLRVYAQYEETM
jgi:hypothetical protein